MLFGHTILQPPLRTPGIIPSLNLQFCGANSYSNEDWSMWPTRLELRFIHFPLSFLHKRNLNKESVRFLIHFQLNTATTVLIDFQYSVLTQTFTSQVHSILERWLLKASEMHHYALFRFVSLSFLLLEALAYRYFPSANAESNLETACSFNRGFSDCAYFVVCMFQHIVSHCIAQGCKTGQTIASASHYT